MEPVEVLKLKSWKLLSNAIKEYEHDYNYHYRLICAKITDRGLKSKLTNGITSKFDFYIQPEHVRAQLAILDTAGHTKPWKSLVKYIMKRLFCNKTRGHNLL